MLRGSCSVQSLGAAGVLVAATTGAGLMPLIVALVVAVGFSGAILPTGVGLAMEDHPGLAGSASRLFGFVQSIVAGGVAPLVGLAGPRAPLPMAIVMAACAWSALIVLRLTDRRGHAPRAALGARPTQLLTTQGLVITSCGECSRPPNEGTRPLLA